MFVPYAVNVFPRFVILLLAATSLALWGCSLLVDAGRDQCTSDDDCTHIGLPGSCDQGVCIASMQRTAPVTTPDDQAGCDGGSCGRSDAGSAAGRAPASDGTCSEDADCARDARCFKQTCAPASLVEPFLCAAPEPEAVSMVHFAMPAREFVSDQAPKGLKASACRVNDIGCADPIASFEDSSGMGMIELDLPLGFDGFLDVRSDETLPALWYFTQPITAPRVAKSLGMVAPGTLSLLAAITGYTVEADKGVVVLEAFDCSKTAVGGIHFEESKHAAVPFFIIDSTPSAESTVTVRDEKTDNAPGGFLNATPGFTLFTARIGVDGPVLGEFNAHVRANTVTYLDIYP